MSTSTSPVYGIAAPLLTGAWVFDPTDPDATTRNYLFADARSVGIAPDAATLKVAGRVNPLLEFGESTVLTLKLTVLVPFGEDYDADMEWWEDAVRNRRAINYRDNRGRLYWVGLPSGLDVTDGRMGSAFSLSLLRLNYDEAVA